jgi:glycosyltransferase involved in cell wall biosynthesis
LGAPIAAVDRRLIDFGIRAADAVIVQTRHQAVLLRSAYARADAIHVPNCHPDVYDDVGKRPHPLLVCWIGNIKEIKNPEAFIRLAEDFQDRADVHFVMVGGVQMAGSAWRRLRERMAALGNLRFVGPQPQEAVADVLADAHVLVNTSVVEGFPNSVIEAWMRRVAVLSLNVNPDDVFGAERYGLCAHGNYEQLRAGLERLLTDDNFRELLARRSQEFAKKQFSKDNMDRIADLLCSLSPVVD